MSFTGQNEFDCSKTCPYTLQRLYRRYSKPTSFCCFRERYRLIKGKKSKSDFDVIRVLFDSRISAKIDERELTKTMRRTYDKNMIFQRCDSET